LRLHTTLKFRTFRPCVQMLKLHSHVSDKLAKLSLVGVILTFPMRLGLANTFMALTVLFWLLARDYKGRWKAIRHHPLTWPAIGMFVLVVLGTSYTLAPASLALHHVGKYSKFLFIPLVLSLLTEEVWRKRCLYAFCTAMLITLVSTYAGIWWGVPWSVTRGKLGWGVDHTVFKDYIAQGLLMSTFVLLAVAQAIKETVLLRKGFWTVAAVLAIVSILFLSNGRSGYAALLAGLGGFLWTVNRHPFRKLLALMVLVAAVPLAYMSSLTIQARVDEGFTEITDALARPLNQDAAEVTSLGARIDMWRLSIQSMAKNPVFGSGTGSYPLLAKEAFHSQGVLDVQGVHPHNQFLFFGVELGMVGLLAYVFYLYRAGTAGRAMPAVERAVLIGFLCIMVSDSLFNSALWLSTENHLFTFMLALLVAEYRPKNLS